MAKEIITLQVNDIVRCTDISTIRFNRFYEVMAICPGFIRQENLVGLGVLDRLLGVDTKGDKHPLMWVPRALLQDGCVIYRQVDVNA